MKSEEINRVVPVSELIIFGFIEDNVSIVKVPSIISSKLVVATCSSRCYFLLVIIVADDPPFIIIIKAAVKKRTSICKLRWKADVSLQHSLHVNVIIFFFFFFLLKELDSKLGAATAVDPIK
jgi:hypothetical protein